MQLDEDFRHRVKLGNDTRLAVMGKGNIQIVVSGVTHMILEVYYVREL